MANAPSPSRNRLLALSTRLVVGLFMLFVAVAIFAILRAGKPPVEEVDPTATPRTVFAMAVKPVPVQRQWRGYGTAEALYSADVPARVTATVASIPPDILPGARVTQGQLLVQLDASDFERQVEITQQRIAELDAALAQLDVEEKRIEERLALEEADVAIAQTDYDRQVSLRERDVNNAQDVDAAQRTLINAKRSRLQTREAADLIGPRRQSLQAQKSSQQSQVNLAQVNQQRTTITSPIDGVVQSIDVEVGENLAAGQKVARVVALQRIEVPLQLPAAARSSVAVGDRVHLRPTSTPAVLGVAPGWSTTIARINPEQDPSTRTLTVYAELSREGDEFHLPAPGMFLEATVAVAEKTPRLIVPRRAIRKDRVQVIRDGVLVSRPVAVAYTVTGRKPGLGLDDDQWAVIDEGLEAGDLVLINAATLIADGTPVEVNLAGDADPGAAAADPAASGEDAAPRGGGVAP